MSAASVGGMEINKAAIIICRYQVVQVFNIISYGNEWSSFVEYYFLCDILEPIQVEAISVKEILTTVHMNWSLHSRFINFKS